jgi:hypothetical protein
VIDGLRGAANNAAGYFSDGFRNRFAGEHFIDTRLRVEAKLLVIEFLAVDLSVFRAINENLTAHIN